VTGPAPHHQPPFWAVIFTSRRRDDGHDDEYGRAAERMETLARQVEGYIGVESVRDETGLGITVSYWESEDAIAAWRNHPEHLDTQARGRRDWYERYELRVARVDRVAGFTA
jgi:heme-degrading monooxygenase HmoA